MPEDPPEGRIVEIRVHGVHGGHPADALDDPFPRQVAGDDTARFWRRRVEPADGHVLEAFDWGRFTSGSPTRALWLLLIPFAMLNLAGFTLLPATSDLTRRVAGLMQVVLRLLGLVLTLVLLLAAARIGMDLVAHQCAAAPRCLEANSWLRPFGSVGEGVRLLVGLAPAALAIVLLGQFGRQTFLYDPPGRPADGSFGDDLGDRGFWHTGTWATPLRSAHVIAAGATVGLLCLAYLDVPRVGAMPVAGGMTGTLRVLLLTLFVFALVVVARPMLWIEAPGSAGPVAESLMARPRRWTDHLRPSRWTAAGVLEGMRRLALAIVVLTAVGTVAVTASARPAEPLDSGRAALPGFETAAVVVLSAVPVLLGLLLVGCVVLRLGYGRPAGTPTAFRPLWAGLGPVVLSSVAATLAGGFSGGLVFWVGNILGRVGEPGAGDPPEYSIDLGMTFEATGRASGVIAMGLLALLPALAMALLRAGSYAVFVLAAVPAVAAFGVSGPARWWAVGAAVVLVVVGVVVSVRTWGSEELGEQVSRDYTPGRDGQSQRLGPETTPGKIAGQWRLARSKYRYHWPLGAIAPLLLVGLGLVRSFPDSSDFPVPEAVGPFVLAGVAAGFVTLGLRSWSNASLRTTVGILWDLLAFWPRSAHPLCPPPYGGRAVLELARRTADIADTRGNEVVVLSGHSQGSLICAAAVAVLQKESEIEDGDRGQPEYLEKATAEKTLPKVGMVTYGSQLQWAYARLFPRYVGFEVLQELHGPVLRGRWRNLHRYTDPLGGPVLAWPIDGEPQPRGRRAATDKWEYLTATGRATDIPENQCVGHEMRLHDPVRIRLEPRTVRAPLLGHSDSSPTTSTGRPSRR